VVNLRDLSSRLGEGATAAAPSAPLSGAARTPSSTVTLLPLVQAAFPGKGDTGSATRPDPTGAVGPDHAVYLGNNGLLIRDKRSGAIVVDTFVSLRDFWSSLLPGGQVVTAPSSPRILYDQYAGRFVAFSLEGVRNVSRSHLLLAVSQGPDPLGTWYQWSIAQTAAAAANGFGDNVYADDAAPGIDGERLYVALNLYDSLGQFSRSRILAVPRELLASPPTDPLDSHIVTVVPGTAPAIAALPPFLSVVDDPTGVASIPNGPVAPSVKEGFSIRPVHAFDNASVPWFLFGSTYFHGDFQGGIEAGRFRTRFLGVGRLADSDLDGVLDNVDWGYAAVPGYSDIFPTGSDRMVQPKSSLAVDWGGTRLRNAVYRRGFLHTVQSTPHYDLPAVWDNLAGQQRFHSDVEWYRLRIDGAAADNLLYRPRGLDPYPTDTDPLVRSQKIEAIRQQFLAAFPTALSTENLARLDNRYLRITDPSGALDNTRRSFAYPSLAVNGLGDVAIGFTGSSARDYLTAYATGWKGSSTDPQGIAPLKAGLSPFERLDGSQAGWGATSATCVDPSDDTTFWTVQEYAEERGTTSGIFGTWWAHLDVSGVPAAPSPGGEGIFGTGSGGCSVPGGTAGGGAAAFSALVAAALAAGRLSRSRRNGRKR
jgi:hypothetical protein